jgi:glycosyltransferase involved in cell wall biosynthesis
MEIVHLTASSFFGGPERQMLGLAQALRPTVLTRFVLFSEAGRHHDFQVELQKNGFDCTILVRDTPAFWATYRALVEELQRQPPIVLFCHGYKANILGRLAARRVGIPVVAVSRGWTAESLKVRLYEWMDRINLRLMDHVVAVSIGQAEKVTRAGVASDKLTVIRNSSRLQAFITPDLAARADLISLFPVQGAVRRVILGAGRLSPEKGFDLLITAAQQALPKLPGIGIAVFGEGKERERLEQQIERSGLADRIILPGHTKELDRLIPWAESLVIPSYTEGLPNVALEASAASIPTIATRVGGNPEIVVDQVTGLLVDSGDSTALADAMVRLHSDAGLRRRLGQAARDRVEAEFTFNAQAEAYKKLLARWQPPLVLQKRVA